jgi:phage terminase large subunit GpA-like protein
MLREDYQLGQVPAGALMLTAFSDTQDDRLEVYVYGWGRGEECWLVDFQVLHGDPSQEGQGSVWEALDLILAKRYPHAGGKTLRINALGVDEGGHHTQEARIFALKRQRRHVLACKGQAVGGKPVLGPGKLVDIDHRGIKIEQGVKLWPLGVDTGKTRLYNRLGVMLRAYREHTDPGVSRIHFPAGIPDTYFEQLVAEKLRSRLLPSGFRKAEWIKPSDKANEALDCWVGAYAMAIYAGVQRVDWNALEAMITPKRPDSEKAAMTPAAEPDDPPPAPTSLVPSLHGPLQRAFGRNSGKKNRLRAGNDEYAANRASSLSGV